ncbi:unnamed protein product [Parnassius apollo]|uniref:Regulatory protein zeste n=1 Tax=Parnassius apollo TaxID=110799 RepID=A0A8S3WHJ3_PARAO|nr:unnamed protein product [Parnassius apollo]
MESKGNNTPENQKNRARGENWTQEEKDLFLEIMRESAPIIESKFTDTNTNKRKNLEWIRVQKSLKELTGKSREITQLKGFWRRTKVAAKKSVAQHRRALQATGGGQRPTSPGDDHLKIVELCPTDFVIEENLYDSDAVPQHVEVIVLGGTEEQNNTLYDIDEDEILPAEEPAEQQMITVANVHSEEIDIKMPECSRKTQMMFPPKVDKKQIREKKTNKLAGKEALLRSNIEFKERASAMLEEEHKLKIKFQEQEIAHQQLRHRLEIEILILERDKKKLELELLKKN